MSEPIPAATLILWRDPGEVLMVERNAAMAFAAGAMVFPGGRVDPGDREPAAGAKDPEDAAARIAAIRETIEEVGVAVGIVPVPDPATLAHWRVALATGGGLASLLAAGGHHLDPDALVPFARWRPNSPERRTFDTRFYLARAPDGAVAEADGSESTHAVWARPADILADADAERRHIIFPTRRNLERLATFADHAAADAHARAHPVRLISPWIETRDGEDWLCIPGDAGYPVTAEPMSRVRRG